jgi:hypothetical protein
MCVCSTRCWTDIPMMRENATGSCAGPSRMVCWRCEGQDGDWVWSESAKSLARLLLRYIPGLYLDIINNSGLWNRLWPSYPDSLTAHPAWVCATAEPARQGRCCERGSDDVYRQTLLTAPRAWQALDGGMDRVRSCKGIAERQKEPENHSTRLKLFRLATTTSNVFLHAGNDSPLTLLPLHLLPPHLMSKECERIPSCVRLHVSNHAALYAGTKETGRRNCLTLLDKVRQHKVLKVPEQQYQKYPPQKQGAAS